MTPTYWPIVVLFLLKLTSNLHHVTMDSFLNQGVGYDQEDLDDMNNQLAATNNDTFLSTPGPMYSNPPTSVVVPMALPMLDRQMKKFNGFMHEDGSKFLEGFKSYLTLSGIDHSSSRAVAAFHLQLHGPALIWFNALPISIKSTWFTLETESKKKFCNITNNPSLVAEEATFNTLTLKPGQPIEEFASVVQEKGRRLTKSDRDMTFKFIDGLPSQLAFFVRAGRVDTLRDALHSAKLGEAHGYRSHNATQTVATQDSLSSLTQRVQALELNNVTSRQKDQSVNSNSKTRVPNRPKGACFKCTRAGHLKCSCNWNGNGQPHPDTRCQLCRQMGHLASFCLKLTPKTVTRQENCQLCSSDSHTAKECPQLNARGLGSPRGSQA